MINKITYLVYIKRRGDFSTRLFESFSKYIPMIFRPGKVVELQIIANHSWFSKTVSFVGEHGQLTSVIPLVKTIIIGCHDVKIKLIMADFV